MILIAIRIAIEGLNAMFTDQFKVNLTSSLKETNLSFMDRIIAILKFC